MVALFQMAGDTGAVTGPVAAGFLVDTASYAAAFAVAAAVLGGAAVLGFWSPETRPREAPVHVRAGPGQAQVVMDPARMHGDGA